MKKEFKNQTQYFPTEHESNFTIINNKLLEDDRLSLLDVGIMVYILKFVNFNYDGRKYIVNKKAIESRSGFGYNLFTKHWNNLIECGYIIQTRKKGGWEYEIYENPLKNSTTKQDKPSQHLAILTNVKTTNCINATIESKYLRKEIQEENLEPLDLGGESKEIDSIVTDKIISAKAEMSLSLTGARKRDTPLDCNIDCYSNKDKGLSPKLDYGFSALDEGQSLFEQEDFIDEDSIVLKPKAKEFDIKNNNKRYATQNQLPLFNTL